jgi:starch synthase (maltosyl-transferring)
VWGDLAEIAYDNPNTRPALIEYWVELIRHHLQLGFKGFRCDAAYQVPLEVWQGIIGPAKVVDPECAFFAETLGCTPDQALGLKAAGFDYLFNSAKWWDFRAPWLLGSTSCTAVAPTIAFLRATTRRVSRSSWAIPDRACAPLSPARPFAAAFSTGG